MQEFQFKPKNYIHYQTRKGLLKGSYIIKSIDIQITSRKTYDLYILKMHKKLIEKALVHYLNSKSYKDDIKKNEINFIRTPLRVSFYSMSIYDNILSVMFYDYMYRKR